MSNEDRKVYHESPGEIEPSMMGTGPTGGSGAFGKDEAGIQGREQAKAGQGVVAETSEIGTESRQGNDPTQPER